MGIEYTKPTQRNERHSIPGFFVEQMQTIRQMVGIFRTIQTILGKITFGRSGVEVPQKSAFSGSLVCFDLGFLFQLLYLRFSYTYYNAGVSYGGIAQVISRRLL